MKTSSGVHGLGFAITKPTYNKNNLDQQETWILETDTNESTQVQDLVLCQSNIDMPGATMQTYGKKEIHG